ncbi:uncharacterized protein LOC132737754 isoform X2 [Ruditapes philippinarum]|uniref:uncharacterized protein LOC132737754 isoform X2 n=2 Tax=Ruditapes philippinarum TaxID=129788 RepID=UPI00295BE70B|nr:uncharacterized protein LOC132737754 isoform X2 [Ruditapes philippinarum]
MDCFLESFTTPTLQIDINGELQQKTVRSAQRYLSGKEVFSNIFDEAQLSVFKELLPYWAGFRKTYSPPDDPNKKPVTKYQKMLKKRMESIDNYVIPPNEFQLPSIPEGAIAAFTFSLSDGVKLRHSDTASDISHELTQGEENNLAYVMDSSTRGSKTDILSKNRASISSVNNPSSTSSKKENSSLSAKS